MIQLCLSCREAGYMLGSKLKELKERLIKWNKENFGVVEMRIKTEYNKIEELDKKEENGQLDEEGRLEHRIAHSYRP